MKSAVSRWGSCQSCRTFLLTLLEGDRDSCARNRGLGLLGRQIRVSVWVFIG